MIRSLIASVWLVAAICPALAQSELGRPQTGAVGLHALPEPPTFSASGSTDVLRHRSPSGGPCLNVSGMSRAHRVSPNVFDHVVTVKNNCPQRIAMQICYYKTQDCQPLEVPGGERKEAILGTLPAVREFRFEFREKF